MFHVGIIPFRNLKFSSIFVIRKLLSASSGKFNTSSRVTAKYMRLYTSTVVNGNEFRAIRYNEIFYLQSILLIKVAVFPRRYSRINAFEQVGQVNYIIPLLPIISH